MEGKEKLGKDPHNGSDAKEEPTGPKEEQPPQTENDADSNPGDDQIMRDAFQDHMAIDELKVGDVKANDPLLTEVRIGRKGNGSSARVANKLKQTVDKHVGESKSWLSDSEGEESEDGTPLQQAAFMRELESFYRERSLEFKAPKFYGEPLNCLKLWRAVVRAGGYDVVTSSKLWRQVGESFHPPKTCTTVSWTFRIFYEKALLEYEKHKRQTGEIQTAIGSLTQCTTAVKEASSHQAPGSGRARRDAAARAMQGWHAQRLVGYGEIAEPIVKDKNLSTTPKREKNLKSIGSIKHKTPTSLDHAEKTAIVEADKQVVTNIVDLGPPADWVKISVRETKDCFEVYALVPGLLREEVRVQSDPAGRLVITGQPEQLDNPWGITPFKKVVSLPGRIDPIQTSAVVSLHGRLFVRVPFEQGSF
ncbi:putative transcription factor & chromatin remodeling ARID family [Rosa chinensis]|uniref:Putative transcription factor & chromatin remodeling ARID family n=1 Tax=Rosa chinensis TaxID=74649 RepID=A0A2P6PBW9_ROSCH|nr:AT-rich interactive domain-containing protein 6 [Rosa chinensis]XP_024173588.1 AT-rich interactive domain-containing protein 6 [Rosa chinensis]PRQ19418.1 putative transcription factor & chromatin remodeling ARID family [Rosa chinensis]